MLSEHGALLIGPDDGLLREDGQHPWILSLDIHGTPHRWISWQAACHYHARDQVAWSVGDRSFRFLGGICRATGQRSEITTLSIIAIKGRALRPDALRHTPPLNNRELFRRDRHVCAYCGHRLPGSQLTRDHVSPVSQGGRDIWMNVVTACKLSLPKPLPVQSAFSVVPSTMGHRTRRRTSIIYQSSLRVRGARQ